MAAVAGLAYSRLFCSASPLRISGTLGVAGAAWHVQLKRLHTGASRIRTTPWQQSPLQFPLRINHRVCWPNMRYSHSKQEGGNDPPNKPVKSRWRTLGLVGLLAGASLASVAVAVNSTSVFSGRTNDRPISLLDRNADEFSKHPSHPADHPVQENDTATDIDKESIVKATQETHNPEISSWALATDIWRHLRPNWLLLFAIFVVTGASAAISIYTPILIGQIVTTFQGTLNAGSAGSTAIIASMKLPALKLMSLFAAQGVLAFFDVALVARLGEDLSLSLRRELYDAILRQDMAFFDKHMQGEIIGRLSQDVAEFKHTFKLCITQGLKCTSLIIGSIVNLVRLSPSLTLTLVSCMPVLYVFMNVYGYYLRRLSLRARVADSQASSIAGEAVSNIRTVRAFASEDVEMGKYTQAAASASRHSAFLGFHIGLFNGLTISSVGSMILIVVYCGAKLVSNNEMTPGQLIAYLISTQSTERAFTQVGVLFGQVLKALGSASRVFEYTHSKPTIPVTGGIVPSNLIGNIEFRNVSFTFPTRPDVTVLDRFSLNVPAGTVVALCGSSGSGKSTVGQLIERFYDPDSGDILLDGVHLRDLDPSWVRRHIGYIGQEPVLFATSILENIRYGRPEATDAQVREAAKQANAAEFIDGFPKGYATKIGERGVTLSGGQKQRIAIARAILKNPQILILDEATSALDTTSERIVQDALERLMYGRTVLVIAHRLTTIQNADRIVVMSGQDKAKRRDGNIVESGTFEELMRRQGAFYNLSQKDARIVG